MAFTFGRIAVQICGDENLIRSIQNNWKQYELLCTDHSRIDVNLNIWPLQSSKASLPEDGWGTCVLNNEPAVTYSRGGKCLLALQNCEQHENIKVYVNSETYNSVRLGAQFGLLTVLFRQYVGLHGVTVLCGNEIIILSAPSGTGKTTLGKLLERYSDGVIVNGDFALLNPTENGVIFEPTPFCGTSRRCLNHRFQVNRIVFLGQAKENQWRRLDGREAMIRFMSNAFIPNWDNIMQQSVQSNILKCVSGLKVNAFDFAPTKEAAEEFLKQVERDSSMHS